MNEVDDRLNILDAAMKELIVPHGALNAEICFLQLRKICELIALGCLSAHGDLGKGVKSSILKEWNINKIMKALEDLGDNFYPVPVKIEVINGAVQVSDPDPQQILDKKALLHLYGRSGDFLHRGSLKKLFEGKITLVGPEIENAAKQIVA